MLPAAAPPWPSTVTQSRGPGAASVTLYPLGPKRGAATSRAEVRRRFYYHDCSGNIPGHTTRVPPVGDQRLPVLCHCQLGQDIRVPSSHGPHMKEFKSDTSLEVHTTNFMVTVIVILDASDSDRSRDMYHDSLARL